MSVDVSFQKGSRVARAAIVNEILSWRTEQTAFPELLKRKWLALRCVSLPPSAPLPFFVPFVCLVVLILTLRLPRQSGGGKPG